VVRMPSREDEEASRTHHGAASPRAWDRAVQGVSGQGAVVLSSASGTNMGATTSREGKTNLRGVKLLVDQQEATRQELLAIQQQFLSPAAPSTSASKVKHSSDLVLRLMGLSIFQDCSEAFVKKIASLSAELRFNPETTIIREGTQGQTMLVLLRGCIRLSIDDVQVERYSAEPRMEDGSPGKACCMGQMIFLGLVETWQETLVAETACTICEIQLADAEALFNSEDFKAEGQRFQSIREEHEGSDYIFAGTVEKRIGLFQNFSENTVRMLDSVTVRRIFFPGDLMLQEGEIGEELFILVHGHIQIEIGGSGVRQQMVDVSTLRRNHRNRKTNMATQSAPAVFGDLCLLGIRTTRSASIRALSVCQARVLHSSLFLRTVNAMNEVILASNVVVRDDADKAESETEALGRIKIFAAGQCGEAFLRFMADHLEDRMYLGAQTIIKEGDEDDNCLFLISRGTVEVSKRGVGHLCDMPEGQAFGEMFAFGLVKRRTTTVIAKTPCLLRALHQRILMRGLEMFPEERQRILFQMLKSGDLPADAFPQLSTMSGSVASDRDMLVKLLGDSPFFGRGSEAFVQTLAATAEVRIYIAGEVVVQEGDEGDSMFIIISGTVTVFQESDKTIDKEASAKPDGLGLIRSNQLNMNNQNKIAVLPKGSLFGELAALGINETRNATIQSDQLCMMWTINKRNILDSLAQFPDVRKHFATTIMRRLDSTVSPRIHTLPLFSNFCERFRKMVAFDAEKSLYWPGQEIVREGQAGLSMLVINIGFAFLTKKGVHIRPYPPKSCFGALLMVGVAHSYVGTLVSTQTTHIISISRRQYKLALDVCAQTGASRHLIIHEQKENEALQRSMTGEYIRKRIWHRSFECKGNPEDEQRTVFVTWREFAQRSRREREHLRQVEETRTRNLNKWLNKRAEATERVRQRREAEVAPPTTMDRRMLALLGDDGGQSEARDVLPPATSAPPVCGEGRRPATVGSARTPQRSAPPGSRGGLSTTSTLEGSLLDARTPRRGAPPGSREGLEAGSGWMTRRDTSPGVREGFAASASTWDAYLIEGGSARPPRRGTTQGMAASRPITAELPQLRGAVVPEHTGDVLGTLGGSWPTPRISKHYDLKVWSVLRERLGTPGAAPLLPLLKVASAAEGSAESGLSPRPG